MSAMASQTADDSTVCTTVCSSKQHQISSYLPLVRGIHWSMDPWYPPKVPVMRKVFLYYDVFIAMYHRQGRSYRWSKMICTQNSTDFNTCRAEFVWGNIKICFHHFLNTDMAQEVQTIPRERQEHLTVMATGVLATQKKPLYWPISPGIFQSQDQKS